MIKKKKKYLGDFLTGDYGETALKPDPKEIEAITGPKDQAQGREPYNPDKQPDTMASNDPSFGAGFETRDEADALGGKDVSAKEPWTAKRVFKNILKYGAGMGLGALAAKAEGAPVGYGAILGLGLPKHAENMRADRELATKKANIDMTKDQMSDPVFASEKYDQAQTQNPKGFKSLLEATGKYDDPLTTLLKNQLTKSQIKENEANAGRLSRPPEDTMNPKAKFEFLKHKAALGLDKMTEAEVQELQAFRRQEQQEEARK
ncbi:MAG: hypothetical protein KBC72_00585 [Acinetobacter sp.]|nr:hypothetical protein [Acinetobacter sp.]